MATVLTDLQTQIRELGLTANYDIGTTAELARVNRISRRLYLLEKWPESRKEDTSLGTTAGSGTLTFPSSPVFYDVTDVQVKDPYDDNKWKSLVLPENELIWQQAGLEDDEFPRLYSLLTSGTTNQIELRPKPDFTGSTNVKLVGYTEPSAFTATSGAGGTTPYRGTLLDDALANLVAYDILSRRGLMEFAQVRFQAVVEVIRALTGREVTPKELGLAQ